MKKYIKAEIKIIEIESTALMVGSGNVGGPDAPGYLAPKQNESSTPNFGSEHKSENSSVWSDMFSSDKVHDSYEEE